MEAITIILLMLLFQNPNPMQINPYQCQVVFLYLKIKTCLFLVEMSVSCVLYNDFSYNFQYFPYF